MSAASAWRSPEVTEKVTHGSPGFFVRKQFAVLWPNGHHDHEFHRGWIGARLDGPVDWGEVGELLEDAYRVIAPARLARLLHDHGHGDIDREADARRGGRHTAEVDS